MNKKMLLIFFISLLLNTLFFAIGTLFIFRKGGFSYLLGFFTQASRKTEHNPYYLHKKSQFEILSKPDSSTIFLGDSLTDEGEWTELLDTNIRNRGIGGNTTSLVLNYLDTIVESKPKKVFLMIGINDFINEHKSVEKVLIGYREILTGLQKKIPDTKVFIQSVLPVNNKVTRYWQDNNNILELNIKLEELAKEFSYQYIDVFSYLSDSENQLDVQYTSDGLHLNGKGYLMWKKTIEKYVHDRE